MIIFVDQNSNKSSGLISSVGKVGNKINLRSHTEGIFIDNRRNNFCSNMNPWQLFFFL